MCLRFNENQLPNENVASQRKNKDERANNSNKAVASYTKIVKRSKMKDPVENADKAVVAIHNENFNNANNTDSFIHSDNNELCLSREWPITNLTNTSRLKCVPTNQSLAFEPFNLPAQGAENQGKHRGFSFIISEYVSINKDTVGLSSMPPKVVKYLHRKRLEERGYRMTNKKLGEGGFGAVYKIYPKKDGTLPLACKIMLLSKEAKLKKDKNSMLQAYSNEIYVMKSSSHSNIVSIKENFIYSHGQSMENVNMSHSYIIMEYATLGTLYAKLKKYGPFNESTTKEYFNQISNALYHLHERGIAHRDLKLGNILLTSNDNYQEIVKLTDFGLSRLVNSEESGLIRFSKPAGTLSYMSPQIISCYILYNSGNKSSIRPYDPFKADTWALGVCLFLMLTKIHPFENPPSNKAERVEFAKRMLDKQLGKDWQIPISLRLSISEQCNHLLNKLLEPNNKRRLNIYGIINHEWINANKEANQDNKMFDNQCGKHVECS